MQFMQFKTINKFFCKKKNKLKFVMRAFMLLFCTTVFSFSANEVFSQNDEIVINEDKDVTIDEIFDLFREQTKYTFIYQEDLFKNIHAYFFYSINHVL